MKNVLLAMVVLCGLAGIVNAAELAGSEAAITADVTYTTKYMWRGFNLYSADSATQPSIDVAFENGLSFNVWASYANGGGNVNGTEYDYTVAYSNTINEGCATKTDYTVGWRYYDFIDQPSTAADMQEIFLEIAMPELVGGGVTPHAGYYQMWEAKSDSDISGGAGAIFAMGFTYDFTLESAPELPMTFLWDIVYNDGTGNKTIDHDWSHMVWGLSTAMTCPMTGATVTPAVYYQNSFESTVNNGDELWASLSYTLGF